MSRALGLATLLAHDPAHAAQRFRAAWTICSARASTSRGRFRGSGSWSSRSWSSARATRPNLAERLARSPGPSKQSLGAGERAAVRGADRRSPALADAADADERLGLRLDAARTGLSLGRAQRRARQPGSAREALERAAAGRHARLARLGRSGTRRTGARGRMPAAPPGELTRPSSRSPRRRRNGGRTRRSRRPCSSRCTPSRRTCRHVRQPRRCGRSSRTICQVRCKAYQESGSAQFRGTGGGCIRRRGCSRLESLSRALDALTYAVVARTGAAATIMRSSASASVPR